MRSAVGAARKLWAAFPSVLPVLLLFGSLPASLPAQTGLLAAPANTSKSLEDRRQAMQAIFDDYWKDMLQHAPELASRIHGTWLNEPLPDLSPGAYDAALARGEQWIEQLGAIDTTGMTPQEHLSKQLLVDTLVDQQEASICAPWQTPVTPFSGLPVDLPRHAEALRFTSAKDSELYLAKLNSVPKAFLEMSNSMMLSEQARRSVPQFVMQKLLAQVQSLANAKPEDTPFAAPLQHFPASISPAQQTQIRTQVLAAVRTQVQPAYAHFAKFLAVTYIPNARKEPGITANQDGEACYTHLVRHFTTTDLPPTQIFTLGQQQVATLEPQLLAAAHQLGFHDLPALQQTLEQDPKQHAASAAQLVGLYERYTTAMETRLPQLVHKLPKTPLQVVAMSGSPDMALPAAEYSPGTPDGSQPAQLRVNITGVSRRLLPPVQSTAYYEGIPGHHLQISLAEQQAGVPEFRRFAQSPAFVEGWAAYSQQLPQELGLYQDPWSAFALLEARMEHAVSLVADTGVHSQHWTRGQMVEYFRSHTAMDDTAIQTAVDRIVAEPGKALSVEVGNWQILALRAQAEKSLGPRFDLRAFHDAVLDSGALPLDVLEPRMQDWITAQSHTSPAH